MKQSLSPTQVAEYIKGSLEKDPRLSQVLVEGEVCNYTLAGSGHHYFSLKDKSSILPCIMYKQDFPPGFPIENGSQLLIQGNISVFVQRGVYQLRCNKLSFLGAGDLHQQFLLLKSQLEQAGLFHPSHKKLLPPFPKTVALITSLSGAVVWDMLKILKARSPMTKVVVVPVNVQGEGVEFQMAGAVSWADYYKVADVFILGRGGGSQEDLRPFNTQVLAESIFRCNTPIISAVGHEPDVSISDYVADVRAATPTHAAEMAVPLQSELKLLLQQRQEQMAQLLAQKLSFHRSQLDIFASSQGFQDPGHHLREKAQMLDYLDQQLQQAMGRMLTEQRNQCAQLSAALHALSPLEVMGRGYAIPRNDKGELLHSVKDTQVGQSLTLALADGTVHCVTEKIQETN